jgi:hypothetical protein
VLLLLGLIFLFDYLFRFVRSYLVLCQASGSYENQNKKRKEKKKVLTLVDRFPLDLLGDRFKEWLSGFWHGYCYSSWDSFGLKANSSRQRERTLPLSSGFQEAILEVAT